MREIEFGYATPPSGLEKNASFEMKQKIEGEQRLAKEKFGDLIGMVTERYNALPEKMKAEFVAHNNEILEGVIALGLQEGFSTEEITQLELAAILHDLTKADATPEKYKEVPNYGLVMHAKRAAEEVPAVLTDEKLRAYAAAGDLDELRQVVSKAILEHMGPRPGFMSGMIEGANAKLKELGENPIDYPEANGKISEALLAADMRSLAGINGRKKVLAIRANVPFFKAQDEETVREYHAYGIQLTPEEAALLSGFESAFQARDMIKNEAYREWVDASINESRTERYELGGKLVSGDAVLRKKRMFEMMKASTVKH